MGSAAPGERNLVANVTIKVNDAPLNELDRKVEALLNKFRQLGTQAASAFATASAAAARVGSDAAAAADPFEKLTQAIDRLNQNVVAGATRSTAAQKAHQQSVERTAQAYAAQARAVELSTQQQVRAVQAVAQAQVQAAQQTARQTQSISAQQLLMPPSEYRGTNELALMQLQQNWRQLDQSGVYDRVAFDAYEAQARARMQAEAAAEAARAKAVVPYMQGPAGNGAYDQAYNAWYNQQYRNRQPGPYMGSWGPYTGAAVGPYMGGGGYGAWMGGPGGGGPYYTPPGGAGSTFGVPGPSGWSVSGGGPAGPSGGYGSGGYWSPGKGGTWIWTPSSGPGLGAMSAGATFGSSSAAPVGGTLGRISSMLGGPGIGSAASTALNVASEWGGILLTAGKAFDKMYQQNQQFYQGLSVTRKELGLTAEEAAKMRAMMSFTMDPNSPFSTITLMQVQAGLQNISDVEKGLLPSNNQIDRMKDGLTQLGVSATYAGGRVKTISDFTLELSQKMSALRGSDPGRYTQIMSDIGGLFGKDFAAIVGTNFETLKSAYDGAARVSEQDLELTDKRTAALANLQAAERNVAGMLTDILMPADIAWAQTRTNILNGIVDLSERLGQLSANVMGVNPLQTKGIDTSNLDNVRQRVKDINVEIQNLTDHPPMMSALPWPLNLAFPDALKAPGLGSAQKQIEGLIKERDQLTKLLPPEERTENAKVAAERQKEFAASAKEAEAALAKLRTEQEKQNNKALADAVANYRDRLKELKGALQDVQDLESKRVGLNSAAISSFDSMMDKVTSAGKGYESYYQQIDDTKDKISELETKSQKTVSYATYNGQPLKGSVDDLMELYFAQNIAAAERGDEATNADRLSRRYAAQAADMARAGSGGGTGYTKSGRPTSSKGSKGPSAGSQLTHAITGEKLDAGGVTQKEQAIDERQAYELNKQYTKLGLEPGTAITTEAIGTAYRKRGLTAEETKQLTELYEKMKELHLQDAEAQFNTMRTSIEGFVGALKDAPDQQDAFNERGDKMAQALTKMATATGLFESAGFVRAIGEAALQAKLAGGGFGQGADAIDKYVDAFTKMQKGLGDLEEYVSGNKNITVEAAKQAGLANETPSTRGPGFDWMNSPEGIKAMQEDQETQAFLSRVGKGQVSGAEVAKRLLKSQGIDVGQGVNTIYNLTFKANTEEATKVAGELDKKMQEVTAKTWELKVQFPKTFTDRMDLMRQLLEGSLPIAQNASEQEGFKPPNWPQGVPWNAPYIPTETKVAQPAPNFNNALLGGYTFSKSGVELNISPVLKPDRVHMEMDLTKLTDDLTVKSTEDPVKTTALWDAAKWLKLDLDLHAKQAEMQNWALTNPIYMPVVLQTPSVTTPAGQGPGLGGVAGTEGVAGPPNPNDTFKPPSNIPLPGRRHGGRVKANQPYEVGEDGKEVVVPDQDGTVFSEAEIAAVYAAAAIGRPPMALGNQMSGPGQPKPWSGDGKWANIVALGRIVDPHVEAWARGESGGWKPPGPGEPDRLSSRPVRGTPIMSVSQIGDTIHIQVDARETTSPVATTKRVTRAARFLSDTLAMQGRQERRRRGVMG